MTIQIEGMDELLKRITTIQQFRHVKASFRKAGVVLKGYISRYPGERHGRNPNLYGNSARAQRMRAGYFARLKSGEIDVPYRRGMSSGSQKLGHSWTVTQPAGGFTTIIGTSVGYSPLVQDETRQAMYHKATGWVTVQRVETQHGQEVIDYIRQGIEKELKQG